MRISIFVILAVLGFSAAAQADRIHQDNCDKKCQFHKHAPGTGLKPAVRNEVCFRFVQDQSRFVTFTLYDVYAGKGSPDNHVLSMVKHKVPDGVRGQFCRGVDSYVSKAVWVEICNDLNHSARGIPSIIEGLRTGHVDMCLLGETCPRYVAGVQ